MSLDYVILFATMHGTIRLDEHNKPDTFDLRDLAPDMELVKINAANVGVVNRCSQEGFQFAKQIVIDTIAETDDEPMDFTAETIASKLQALSRDPRLTGYQIGRETVFDRQYRRHTDTSYRVSKFGLSSNRFEIIDKVFGADLYFEDGIYVLNMEGHPDIIGMLEDTGLPAPYCLSDVIMFLNARGIRKVLFVDMSCSSLAPKVTPREERFIRRHAQQFHGGRKQKRIRTKHRRQNTKRKGTLKRRTKRNK